MKKMTTEEFVTLVEDDVERQFPKGKSKSRGKAIALIAVIAHRLQEQGFIKENS